MTKLGTIECSLFARSCTPHFADPFPYRTPLSLSPSGPAGTTSSKPPSDPRRLRRSSQHLHLGNCEAVACPAAARTRSTSLTRRWIGTWRRGAAIGLPCGGSQRIGPQGTYRYCELADLRSRFANALEALGRWAYRSSASRSLRKVVEVVGLFHPARGKATLEHQAFVCEAGVKQYIVQSLALVAQLGGR